MNLVTATRDPVLSEDWHVACRSTEVAEGSVLGTRILGEDIVIWREDSRVHAWKDLCVHRGARLSLGVVEKGTLKCPYHGWTYDSEGKCVLMPAHPNIKPSPRANVTVYQAREEYGYVYVKMGSSLSGLPIFPEYSDPTFRKIHCGPYTMKASAPRVVENFLDVAHFPFVHEGILGDKGYAEIADYDVMTDERGITTSEIQVWQPNPDGSGSGKKVAYIYRVFRPLTAYFIKRSGSDAFSIFMNVTPLNPAESVMWMIIAMNYGFEVPDERIRSFQDRIVAQDKQIVESQRPELLPLDLQAELHLRSDRTAIAYRRWLKSLGVSFGTA
jgi:phenylpropionate dioxygenase-like ring-hydroxylating dioxygenase large terminal subunit